MHAIMAGRHVTNATITTTADALTREGRRVLTTANVLVVCIAE